MGALRSWKNLGPKSKQGPSFPRRTSDRWPELLLDTCVYIDGLQGRAPDSVADLLDIRLSNHSSIAVQELMDTMGVLDPKHPSTNAAIRQIKKVIEAMRSHRIFVPDLDVLGQAALLSGTLCRLQGYQRDARLRALPDCTLFLQAQKLGLTVLTANVSDFDYLLQLIPTGKVIFYAPKIRRSLRGQLKSRAAFSLRLVELL